MENDKKKLKEFNLRNLKLSFYFAYERYNIYVKKQLNFVDGVMLGRKIYSDPAFLLQIDKEVYGNNTNLEFSKGMQNYMAYILTLKNKKDVNRAVTHLLQIIRKLSHTKEIRRRLLDNVKNTSLDLEDVFNCFKEDLDQKAHLQIH